MTTIRVLLCAEDQTRYEVGELLLDTEQLKDMRADELVKFEQESDAALASLLPLIEPTVSKLAIARRSAAFLAMRQSGYDVRWDEFQPKLLRAEFEQVEVPRADPPAGSSESSSEAEPSPVS
ncbi:hypothetical protein ACFYL6_20895 [Micromonospora sp. NPDC007208]|uniref:hypothetical protein n=1 Tax=Micromonospora sp. NPDC007208 TaxID=3364236 RepID=UPI0036A1DC08